MDLWFAEKATHQPGPSGLVNWLLARRTSNGKQCCKPLSTNVSHARVEQKTQNWRLLRDCFDMRVLFSCQGCDFAFIRRTRIFDERSTPTGFFWNSQHVGGNKLATCIGGEKFHNCTAHFFNATTFCALFCLWSWTFFPFSVPRSSSLDFRHRYGTQVLNDQEQQQPAVICRLC